MKEKHLLSWVSKLEKAYFFLLLVEVYKHRPTVNDTFLFSSVLQNKM